MSKKYKKVFVAGANGMLGTTLQSILEDTKNFFFTDKEISTTVEYCDIRDLSNVTEL
jgi:dTDP-4-dehydrorhamnose reductase